MFTLSKATQQNFLQIWRIVNEKLTTVFQQIVQNDHKHFAFVMYSFIAYNLLENCC